MGEVLVREGLLFRQSFGRRPTDRVQLSAMREVSLAREIHEAGIAGMGYLYMGG